MPQCAGSVSAAHGSFFVYTGAALTGSTSVASHKRATSKYADLPEEEKEKRRAKARESYYRKKFLLQTDPVVATSACVGHSTPSTIAVSATYHTGNGNIGCLVEHCSFDKFSSFEF